MSSRQPPFPVRDYLSPRYWPTWLGLGLLRLAAVLPYPAQRALGAGLGMLLWPLPLPQKRVARINLALCFPDLSPPERARLLRRHYRALGMGVVELAMSWWSSDRKLARLGSLEGLEHLQAALARGRGVLLLSAHFTTLEVGGRLLARHVPFAVMYRDQKNRLFDAVMLRGRARNFHAAIHRNDVRGLLRCLKHNLPVWYAPDQNFAGLQSVFAPFCGIPAATSSATARLARTSGAAVVPFFQERLPGARGYRLRILPPLEDFPGDDLVAATARINRLIEEQMRRMPEQYFWVHRRFKNRPAGAPGYY